MLIQAAAAEWKVPASECKAEASVITHTPTGRKTTYGKVASAAAKLPVPDAKDIKLKDPKDWKIAGKPLQAPRHGRQAQRPQGLCHRRQAARHAQRRHQGRARVRRPRSSASTPPRSQGMPGVRHVVKVNPTAVAVVADTWWQAKTALEALPVTYEDSPNSKVSSASIAEHLKEGPDRQGGARQRQPQRRCAGGHRRRGQEDRGRLFDAVPQPRLHGADELHGQVHARALRGVVADAERRGLARRRVRGVRAAAQAVRGLQDGPRRRLRPARRRPGLRAPGGRRSPSRCRACRSS